LIIYDYVLTASQEVKYVWGNRVTLPAAVFYCNRYLVVAYGIIGICSILPWSNFAVRLPLISKRSCLTLVCRGVFFASFSALRVYAVSGQNIQLTLTVGILALVCTVCELVWLEILGDEQSISTRTSRCL
ncbi:hypothetical protein WOLCODRAFT_67003, partial [Wolfiporia cocos MD-104 SS10]